MTLTDKINRAIVLNKLGGAKALLKEKFDNEDEAEFIANEQGTYDSLFLVKEVYTEVDENDIETVYTRNVLKEDAPTFEDWRNETKTVLIDTVIKTDDNGVEYPEEVFVEQLIRPTFEAKDNTLKIEEFLDNNKTNLANIKKSKNDLLNRATVVVNGKEFYADPTSRVDISDAIGIAEVDGLDTTMWKLVSGWHEVTLYELKQARKLSLQNKANIIGGL